VINYCRSSLRKLFRQYFQYGFWRIRTIQIRGRPATFRQIIPILFVLGWLTLSIGTSLEAICIFTGSLCYFIFTGIACWSS